MSTALKDKQTDTWLKKTRECNKLFAKSNIPVIFLEADLEFAALSEVKSISEIAAKKYGDKPTKDKFLKMLGSKGVDCKAKKDSFKAPWFRGFIGANVPANELSACVCNILKVWGDAASSNFDIMAFLKDGKIL